MDRQIGIIGADSSPKLYLALGISGAIQHLVGMKGARTDHRSQLKTRKRQFEIAVSQWWKSFLMSYRRSLKK